MKKFRVILFVLFVAVSSVFAQEQIGNRLKYEVLGPSYNGSDYCFRIMDVYATEWVYVFSFDKSVNTIFDIYVYSRRQKISTAELYSDDFQNVIIQYITSTAKEGGGNAEWIQYASTIANKMAGHIKSRNPYNGTPPPSTSYSGRMSGSQTLDIRLVIGNITASNDVINSSYRYYSNGKWGDPIELTGNITNGTLTLYEKEQNNRNVNRAIFIFSNFNINSYSIAGIWQDLRDGYSNHRYDVQLSKQ